MAQGFETYRVDEYWSAVQSVMPAESHLLGAPGHNSLGYRGAEPAWDQPHVVFVGDERTKGGGIDDRQRWTFEVASRMGAAEINFGRADASNEWIMAQAIRVIELYQPRMVVQWTDPGRYLFADEKGRYRDFLEDTTIDRKGRFLQSRVETARRAFYDIATPGLGLHRLMLNATLLAELADAMGSRLIQVGAFLDDASLAFFGARVECVPGPTDGLAEAILEKLR